MNMQTNVGMQAQQRVPLIDMFETYHAIQEVLEEEELLCELSRHLAGAVLFIRTGRDTFRIEAGPGE